MWALVAVGFCMAALMMTASSLFAVNKNLMLLCFVCVVILFFVFMTIGASLRQDSFGEEGEDKDVDG